MAVSSGRKRSGSQGRKSSSLQYAAAMILVPLFLRPFQDAAAAIKDMRKHRVCLYTLPHLASHGSITHTECAFAPVTKKMSMALHSFSIYAHENQNVWILDHFPSSIHASPYFCTKMLSTSCPRCIERHGCDSSRAARLC